MKPSESTDLSAPSATPPACRARSARAGGRVQQGARHAPGLPADCSAFRTTSVTSRTRRRTIPGAPVLSRRDFCAQAIERKYGKSGPRCC